MKNKLFDENLDLLESVSNDVEIVDEKVNEDIVIIPTKTRKKVEKGEEKIMYGLFAGLAFLCFLMLIVVLLVSVTYLPIFGSNADNLTLNEIVKEYIENGIEQTGATNFVTGMILDYRAFDTLGESFVLFSSVTCVMILLEKFQDPDEPKIEKIKLFHDPILRYGASIMVPIIFVFGGYVILNGSISPGGGFSGGAIMGAGLILYSLAFREEKIKKLFNIKTFKVITSVSLLTYCGCKAVSFYTSVNGPVIHTFGIPGAIFSGGFIFILNCCVGLVVACTMFGFYLLFKRGEI
jgi:multicomponent Na+:H+ antiporter subunit B